MNMHHPELTAPVAAGIAQPFHGRDDADLIKRCIRAKRLFAREKSAEQRLFDATDRGVSVKKPTASLEAAVDDLRSAIGEIADIRALTSEGMAFKAALLEPWVAAGFDIDDPGEGHKLALSIAFDACAIGSRLTCQKAKRFSRRPPRSEISPSSQH